MGNDRIQSLYERSTEKRWNPIPLDYLLKRYSLADGRVQLLFVIWIFFIAASIISVFLLSPPRALMGDEYQSLYTFFMMYPPLFLGTLVMFWVGFEWGFIPVFLSAFLIAYSSYMPIHWALLFGVAFILGLAIFALCYHSLPVSPRPDNLKRIAFFTTVAFVAALASSLGSFVWSLYHDLSAAETFTIWKGWWTGTFLQSMILVGPLLYFCTPSIERVKSNYFEIPEPDVTLKWIYTAILSVVVVLTLFIVGANVLGSLGMQQEMAGMPSSVEKNFAKITGSFQIITWNSIGLVMAAGMGGIYLVGSWNDNLKAKVEEQTEELEERKSSLKAALEQRDQLLDRVNNRVKDNLTMVLALLELQLKTGEQESVEKTLKDSHARLRSLAIVYETMHQTNAIDNVHLKQFCLKLSNRLSHSFKQVDQAIDVHIDSDDITLEIEKAVPLAMILNELLLNSYIHAFKGRESGTIFVKMREREQEILISVRDNGIGLPEGFDPAKQKTLGMKLILTLTRQLNGVFQVDQTYNTGFNLDIPVEAAGA
ncbi:histidine kinase dimerization/phosphoacceptor domain -containing protein [Halalkalibaculum sp. DA3122]|uniref:histidine kinase dimerization/phosphoacceptor domain -containing protein n=1 Tax=Halalkalibaculum sp. DA3122 TaxID=3373607 RepID=UPI003753ECA5